MFFSLEMSGQELTQRLLAAESGLPFADLRAGRLSEREWTALYDTIRRTLGAPLYVDDAAAPTLPEIAARARRLQGDRAGAPAEIVEILEVFERGLFAPGFDLSDVRRACAPTLETERAFRQRFGGTFKSYATDLRLKAADELLARPDVPLPRIGPGLGFREE